MVFGVTRRDPKDVTKVVKFLFYFILFYFFVEPFHLFAFMTLLQPFIALIIGRTISHTIFFYDATIALAVDHMLITCQIFIN